MWEWETSVVLVTNSVGEVLLVRQNYGHRFFGLPGGGIEDDESPEQAAIRELYEETGLRTESVTPRGSHDLIYPGTGRRYRAHCFVADHLTGDLDIKMPDEISSVGWYAQNALPTPLTPSAAAVLALRQAQGT